MKALIFGSAALLSLSGCSSEVDKCVAEWDKANPGPDNGGDYCEPLYRDYETGKCEKYKSRTKADVRADVRLQCLRASK